MFVILYRWRVKSEKEAQFIEAWSEITKYYLKNFRSKGSRLHRGDDEIFYAYAQWNSIEDREKALKDSPEINIGSKMIETIEESFPEVFLNIIEDFWDSTRV